MISTKKKLHYTGIFIIIMHVTGFIGMQFSYSRVWFEALTPLNLLVSAGALLYFHQSYSFKFILISCLIALGGFVVEVLGVHTEVIFGKYAYGSNLGWKLWEVPLLMGINWWILIYCFHTFIRQYSTNILINSTFTAFSMVLLDILIEPVAILRDLWHWFGQVPPMQNYIAWFICAFILAFIIHLGRFSKDNPLTKYILVAQVLFFGLHQFF